MYVMLANDIFLYYICMAFILILYICLVLICLQDDVMTKFSLVCTLIVLCTNHIVHVVNFKGLIQCSESTIKVNDD